MSVRAFKTLFGLGPWLKGEALAHKLQEQGVEAFNKARSRNPQWQPDFRNADLRGMDLSLANLKNANLVGANVDGVILDNLELYGERARNALARRGAVVE